MRAGWLLALTLAGALAGTPAAGTARADADAPFLWQLRIAGDAAAPTHHLIGSVHLLPASAQPLPAAYLHAYAAAQRVVFETDLEAIESAVLQARMLAAAKQVDDGGLRTEIPAPLYRRLQQRLPQMQLSPASCDAVRAWFCALTLELGAYLRAGFEPAHGVDPQLHARAVKDGKPVVWLEAPEQQLELFIAMPAGLGAQFLASALDGLDDEALSPQRLLDAWRANDVAHLAEQVERMRRDHPQAHARLLAGRNRAWLAPLDAWLRDGTPTLVVVGAAHLVGSDSLIELLRARGYDLVAGGPAP
jgi:uncharacterized protein